MFALGLEALHYEQALDYAFKSEILFHVSIRDLGQLVVLNNRNGRHWGEEVRITRPASGGQFRVILEFGTKHVDVVLDGQPPVRFARGADFGLVNRIIFGDGFSFKIIEPSPPDLGLAPAIGNVDCVTAHMVRGWACNPRQLSRPVLVDVLLNGEVVATAVANRERQDLAAMVPALRYCGFLAHLPPLPQHGEVAVSARVRGARAPLAAEPWFARRQIPPAKAICYADVE
jgi:hypothetical protein